MHYNAVHGPYAAYSGGVEASSEIIITSLESVSLQLSTHYSDLGREGVHDDRFFFT